MSLRRVTNPARVWSADAFCTATAEKSELPPLMTVGYSFALAISPFIMSIGYCVLHLLCVCSAADASQSRDKLS